MEPIRVSPSLYEHLPAVGIGVGAFGLANGVTGLLADLALVPAPMSILLMLAGIWLHLRIYIFPRVVTASVRPRRLDMR